jgi:hypothetical protein
VRAIQRRAMGLLEIPVARHTLELPPRFTTGMAIGTDVAPSDPAIIGALAVGTELLLGVDCSPTSSREREPGRWSCRGLWAGRDGVLTDVTAGLVEESGKGFRLFGAPLDWRGGRGCQMARRESDPPPGLIQEHTEPEQAEEHQCVAKLVVSHVVSPPCCWKGGIPPVFPARQLSVRYRYATELDGLEEACRASLDGKRTVASATQLGDKRDQSLEVGPVCGTLKTLVSLKPIGHVRHHIPAGLDEPRKEPRHVASAHAVQSGPTPPLPIGGVMPTREWLASSSRWCAWKPRTQQPARQYLPPGC